VCTSFIDILRHRYLGKSKHLIGMLKHHKVIPVVIFDGAYLPSKAGTEHERRRYVGFDYQILFKCKK
jgi:hypothetical protein